MRRTMVVSVFAGCGKTWLTNHQNQYGYSMRDSDSSTYEKTARWEKEYINSFMEEAKSGKYDFIFVCQTESVIDEMDRQKIPYVIVEPDNIVWNEQESKERAKERQMLMEGNFQHNCVATYISKVNKDECSIWSQRKSDGTRNTIEIGIEHGKYCIIQMCAFANQEPMQKDLEKVQKAIDKCNDRRNKECLRKSV